ncbi:MAG: hypothetical protein AABX32_06880 [Nanoarchaeota archaeon]
MNPNLEMQVNKTNAGLWTVTYGRKEAPLDIQEAAFAANGLSLVSPAQDAFLRVKENQGIFKPYSRTRADVFYDDRNNQVIIVPGGAISRLVGTANLVDAHRQGREYVIPKNQRDLVYAMVDEMLKNGIAFTAPDGKTQVQTSEFGRNDLTSMLFSDKSLGIEAPEYGDWLQSQGKNVNTFFMDRNDYSRAQKAPYLNKLRVHGPDIDFVVDGDDRDLDDDSGAFGVRFEKTAEGGPKK